jgi:hypothetical protein
MLVLASCILFFQNCSGYQPADPIFQNKLLGGDGYPGKVFANHGDCGDGQINVKSIIRENAVGEYEIVRQDCIDLSTPVQTAQTAFRYSEHDRTVFVNVADVYDERFVVPVENKLTTAFCYAGADNAGLEVLVWYNSEAFDGNADPRLATELFGRVTLGDGRSTGLLSIAPPEVFTDKLVYRSNPTSSPAELVETRSGLNSILRFQFDGAQREVSVTCHKQAAPKFLESDQGYYLKLSPELAAGGTQYAVLSHVNGNDLFKKVDESSPQASANTQEGWDAGYLKINDKVYEMRAQPDGSICLGPGSDPRAPCEMDVLGTIKSDDFPSLYANQNTYATSLTKNLKESTTHLLLTSPSNRTENMIQDYYKSCGANAPYPRHIDYWRSALDIQLASEVLIHLADPTQHAALRAALLDAARTLTGELTGDVLHFPTRECTNDNIEWGAQILNALHHAYLATKLDSIPAFLRSKKQYVADEMVLANSSGALYRRDKLAPLLSAMVVIERAGATVFNSTYENFALTNILKDQVLTLAQAQCSGVTLVFGGWKRSGSGHCGHDRIASARVVHALMDLHGFLSARGLCASDANCTVVQRSVLAYLAFHYKFPTSGVYEYEADRDIELRLRVIPRLFGYAHRFGIKNEDSIQVGFASTDKASLSGMKLQMITNSPTLNDYQSAVMAQGFLEARLMELTAK